MFVIITKMFESAHWLRRTKEKQAICIDLEYSFNDSLPPIIRF